MKPSIEIGHRAAVKVLPSPSSQRIGEQVQRFLNEARAVNIIRHPGLVRDLRSRSVYQTAPLHCDGVSGGTVLRQWLAQPQAPPSIADVLGIGLQLLARSRHRTAESFTAISALFIASLSVSRRKPYSDGEETMLTQALSGNHILDAASH